MKNPIFYMLLISAILGYSCAFDNLDEPDARFYGKIIDQTTGQNYTMSSNSLRIRMWETSYKENPTPRDLNVMDDGTFNNNKLFAGTYKVLAFQGAFWPLEDTLTVQLKSGGETEQNFSVTPYLKVSVVDYNLTGTTLTIRGKLEAPINQGLPNVLDIRPFVAITRYVGAANITSYSDPFRIDINRDFNDGVGDEIYTMTITGLLQGRTFYVRLGARVDDSYKGYNYSEIFSIDVP